MKYPLHPIANIAQLCASRGIHHAVLSPGSRCAPLTLAFTRHPEIVTKTVSDERSAAFVALGMAQQLKKPVVLICTSGSAGLNYAPAVVEAFYQQVPLLIITADRPPEWLNQQEGQTIHQQNMYGANAKQHFQLPTDYSHADAQWQMRRLVSEAINSAMAFPQGPVHINAPFREPLYPPKGEELGFDFSLQGIEEEAPQQHLSEKKWNELLSVWHSCDRKLVVCGQAGKDKKLSKNLAKLGIPVVGDIIANRHDMKGVIRHQDVFLGTRDEDFLKDFQPELLITFGMSVVSKNLKRFLRAFPPKAHWHIQEAGAVADTFQSLTKIIRLKPNHFFGYLQKRSGEHSPEGISYHKKWQSQDHKVKKHCQQFFQSQPFSELEAVQLLLQHLPKNACLHLANSLSVRYANYVHLYKKKGVEVFSNRGVAGIDGSTSTMIGHSLADERLHILLTGDVAFFYDRNAFWNKYWGKNVRILLLNNHGGSIFRMIPAAGVPEFDEYFRTSQPLTAQSLAAEFGLGYRQVQKREEFNKSLPQFLSENKQGQILELNSDSLVNHEVLGLFKDAAV